MPSDLYTCGVVDLKREMDKCAQIRRSFMRWYVLGRIAAVAAYGLWPVVVGNVLAVFFIGLVLERVPWTSLAMVETVLVWIFVARLSVGPITNRMAALNEELAALNEEIRAFVSSQREDKS